MKNWNLKKTSKSVAILGLCGLLIASPVAAQFAVIDAASLVQSTISAINDIQIAANTAQEVINTYTQIENQVRMIANQVANLQRLDFSSLSDLLSFGADLIGALSSIDSAIFEVEGSTAQIDELYRSVDGLLRTTRRLEDRTVRLLQSHEIIEMRGRWFTARRGAVRLGTQVQSIARSIRRIHTLICRLVQEAQIVDGNLDINQVQAQQQAVTQTIMIQSQQIEVVTKRLQTYHIAEEGVMEELTYFQIEQAFRPVEPYTQEQGRIFRPRW